MIIFTIIVYGIWYFILVGQFERPVSRVEGTVHHPPTLSSVWSALALRER